MFFNAVWGRATAIFFIKGRLTFYHVTGQKAKGAAGAPSVLIAYNEENANRLRDCNLNGKYIHLAPKLYFF